MAAGGGGEAFAVGEETWIALHGGKERIWSSEVTQEADREGAGIGGNATLVP